MAARHCLGDQQVIILKIMSFIQIWRAKFWNFTHELFKLAEQPITNSDTHHAKPLFGKGTSFVENVSLHSGRNRNASGLNAINVFPAQSSKRKNHAEVHRCW